MAGRHDEAQAVVDIPDRPEVSEIEDGVLRKVGHVVDDAVGLVAVVPCYRGDAAVFDAAPDLHFTGNHIILAGTQMFVPGNAGPLRAIQKNCPMARLLGGTQELEADSGIELDPWLLEAWM